MTPKALRISTLCLVLSLAGSPYLFSQQDENDPETDELVLIPEGPFEMGNFFELTLAEGREDEFPVHTVIVSDFYLGKHEVTQGLWDEVQAWAVDHGYDLDVAEEGRGPDHPVHSISWESAVKWCNARSKMEGLQPCYWVGKEVYRRGGSWGVRCDWSANGYRLPTEAEWEKAARGGLEGKRFPWGDTISHEQANYCASPYWLNPESPFARPYDVSETDLYHPEYKEEEDIPPPLIEEAYTAPVGSFEANGYGLYDMAGNMFEWCWDWWDENYYSVSPEQDPMGPDKGVHRILRGGSWFGGPQGCRISHRYGKPYTGPHISFGLRVARGPMAVAANSVSFKVVPRSVEEGGGVELTWPSGEGQSYRIRRSDELPEWYLLADEIEATPPLNTFIDEEAPPSRQALYQLNVVE